MTENENKNIDRSRCRRGQKFLFLGNRGFLPQSPSDFVVIQVISALNKVMDMDAPKEVVVDGANQICINGVAVGDWRRMNKICVTDDGMLSFCYGEDGKRFVDFGVHGYERKNRVKNILEYESFEPMKIIWSEDEDIPPKEI